MSCLFGLHVMRLLNNFRRDTDLPQAYAAGSPLDAVIDDNPPQWLLLIDLMQLKHIVRGKSGLQPAAYGIAPGFARQVVLFLKTAVLVSQLVGIANLGAERIQKNDIDAPLAGCRLQLERDMGVESRPFFHAHIALGAAP